MSQEIQELRHQIHMLDRKRKALRAEALVLSLRKKARLAADRRDRARKIDSEILTLNRRIDRIRQQRKPLVKLPTIKLPGKKAKPVTKAPSLSPLAKAKAQAKAQAQAKAAAPSWPSALPPVATFQPSEASEGFPSQAPAMLPAAQGPSGSGFQPSEASPGATPGEALESAGAPESGGMGMGTILLVLGVVAAGGGAALYYWKRKGSPGKRVGMDPVSSPAAKPATAPALGARPAFTLPARTVIPTSPGR